MKKSGGAKPAGAERLPVDLAPFRIELWGTRRAVADGFSAVLGCSEECICVKAGRFTVRFVGRGLHIAALTPQAAVIEGFLSGVEYG